jgi:hypothetical protein
VATDLAKVTFQPGFSATYLNFTALVSFAPGTTYTEAVLIITNLGLRPLSPCSGAGLPGEVWTPVGEEDRYSARSPNDPGFWINGIADAESMAVYGSWGKTVTDPDAAPDWLGRLSQLNVVTQIYDGDPGGCPLLEGSTSSPKFIDPTTPSVYLSVSFTATTSYVQALFTIGDLGFRLADPGYEHSQTAAWHPMSQQASFSQSHRLLIATTWGNSDIWSTQIGAAPDVVNVASYVAGNCRA